MESTCQYLNQSRLYILHGIDVINFDMMLEDLNKMSENIINITYVYTSVACHIYKWSSPS